MPTEPKSSESPIPFQVGCSPICDVVRKPKRRKRKSRPWHRWLGVITALPLIWVLATGVVLNHAEDWGLNEKMTTNSTVLSWYGMTPKSEPQSINVNGLKVTHWDGLTFLQEEPLKLNGSFVAAIPYQQGCMVATTEEVLLFDAEGGLIDTLDELSLPELPLVAVGEHNQLPALRNATGWHQPDEDWIEFTEIEGVEPTAATMSPLEDSTLKDVLASKWAGEGLPLSRVVLDLHSGNFLGSFAKYFYDFVALCTVMLIGTGFVIQCRMLKRAKKKG